jgi:hypothetical protein
MQSWTVMMLAAAGGIGLMVAAPAARAQVSVGVNIGAAPECPYGYYDTAPYGCAPSGYYGPEWFNGGVFIGAGPWFHGRDDFRGHVDNHFHPEHGYKGPAPHAGEHAEANVHAQHMKNFKGNETRDGRGHVAEEHGHK